LPNCCDSVSVVNIIFVKFYTQKKFSAPLFALARMPKWSGKRCDGSIQIARQEVWMEL